MATNRDMLAEAIANAKAVKEMAIANAKAALEEAFTPQLKSMLSLKLQEMADEEISEEEITEDTIEETYDEVEEGFGENGAEPEEGFGEMGEKALDEEIDLEELLAEIENEDEIEETLNEAEESEESEEEETEEEEEEEGKPMDLEDMTDEDLKAMIEDVIADMVEAGELEAGHGEEGESEEGEEEIDLEMDSEEDMDLAELLREIEEETVEESITETTVDTTALTTELENAYATIETLRSELNEINLLNAKLLYTNKIFKAKTLNEDQKVKVLSSFDKATTVKEVKLVFETLNEGLKVKTTSIRENLGRASKPTTTPVTTTKHPIVESNAVFDRMRKLAGLA